VFLARRPDEPLDADLADWYRRLLSTVADQGVRGGQWALHDPVGWPDNQSCHSLLAWTWTGADQARHLVVINFSAQPAQGRIPLPWPDLAGRTWQLSDPFQHNEFDRDGGELAGPGLFVDLKPWQVHLLAVTPRAAP
jgi:hypothetical protein